MKDNAISIVKGDTFTFGVEFSGLNQTVTNLTFTVRNKPTDNTYIFQKTKGSGISLVSSSEDSEGKLTELYKVRIAPEDTKDLDTGSYFYDLEYRQTNGVTSDIFTLLRGAFDIEYAVTQHEEV